MWAVVPKAELADSWFGDATGAPRAMLALLVRIDNFEDGTTQSFTFTTTPVRVGRNPLNDLPLALPFVSQWHAVVVWDAQSITYYDLGSTNGTTVQGQRLGANQPVAVTSHDMEFRIGAVRLVFQLANLPAGVAASLPRRGGEGASVSEGLLRKQASPSGFQSVGEVGGSTMMLDSTALLGGLQSTVFPQRTERALRGLEGAYGAYRRAWQDLSQALMAVLQQLPAEQIPAALSRFVELYGDCQHEPSLQALAQSQGVPLATGDGAATQLVAQLAQYFMPARQPPQSPREMEGFLVRSLVALETFATAYIGLRQGHDTFGTQLIGRSRRSADPTPVEVAEDPKQLLEYLLDWSGDGDARMLELRSEFAEIMTHQVALLNGLMEGVRKLVRVRLSPDSIARDPKVSQGFWSFGPLKAIGFWRRYRQVHEELLEDRELTTAVFGRDFARAYAGALGENFAESDPRRIGPPRGA